MTGWIARLLLTIAVLFASPLSSWAPAQAQTAQEAGSQSIDYAAWEAEASRAESVVQGGIASSAFLLNLRESLVDWRARFLTAQDANAERIATIRAQIDALGPLPEGDGEEPTELTERRAELNRQLTDAQLPSVNASEAFTRANGLIEEIDTILADRQARELFENDPMPINPLNWGSAVIGLVEIGETLDTEIADRLAAHRVSQDGLTGRLPLSVILILAGLALLLRSRSYVGRWAESMQKDVSTRRGIGILSFLISLLQVLLPIAGLVMIGYAVAYLDVLGNTGLAFLEAVVSAIVMTVIALWLAARLFPVSRELTAAFDVDVEARPAFRRTIVLIGVFLGLGTVAEAIATQNAVPLTARGVIVLPVYVGLSFGFLRLSQLLRRHRREELSAADAGDSENSFAQRTLSIVAQAIRVVAVIGPMLAAVGYLNLAEAIMTPTAQSLGILALLVALQSPIRDTYALISRKTREEASQALIPVLMNLLLVLGSLPILALIWGMRPERIWDIISRFNEGFALGGARVTPALALAVLIVFLIGMIATRLLQGALRSTILPRTKLDQGARNAVTSGVGYVGIALATVIAVTSAGLDLTALGVVIGALSVGIGLGLQGVVNNFVSGIILLIERPISEGDWIEVGPNMGIVKSISVRSTRIETFDKTDVIVPNADLIAGTVTNWTRGNTVGRVIVTVGVAYGTNTRRVTEILREIADGHPDVASYPEPGVDFLGFGADSLDFRIRMILRDINNLMDVKNEVHHQIAERFAEEGIEIPFAQRDIWLRNPEALPGAGAAPDRGLPDSPEDPPQGQGA
ncbi:mechanosensitive ion channel family protein [Ponticoccus sp. SC2-23]|uniref:DUF3772 domain-containing protein n=1 Tax=Alexandriicola marinus TaxID=2081710 RepID=UPI000FD6F86B|nr:DUF3772 domain-containing protein [Alexandriicola marinus]MBM1222258.1 mechanosensitive ion channel family protein [Ponticoccus sp. SC6-9]MBM1224371.1 mechanosensitive ion channel family protein [Ponticoccus sp. SC6-15]MBM1229849.1 mechanosensitive ion channel family protein [Ponticoccus sp. SC6-38]MBM1233337.1 mechanosensitive ion channel family protein [Ponticoccus sp. SC6-45]MBM1236713.1 mechanosensitive ion channel family protein [Ponticoccus sp. SC6-49]MBM1244757.1 mechanosensitive io